MKIRYRLRNRQVCKIKNVKNWNFGTDPVEPHDGEADEEEVDDVPTQRNQLLKHYPARN